MAKLFCVYYPVMCIECPDKVGYMKECVNNQPLCIYENECHGTKKKVFSFRYCAIYLF